jgi:diguanylate cyclase (GGDEF)-like protein
MGTGIPSIPLSFLLIGLALLLVAAGWLVSRLDASGAEDGESAASAALRSLVVGGLAGLAAGLAGAGAAVALSGRAPDGGWVWLFRPESVATACVVALLLRFQAGELTRPWLLLGPAVASFTPWALAPLASQLDARATLGPLPAGLAAAVLASLLLAPGRRARIVAQARQAAARAAGDGILVIDHRGRVLDANGPARQALNLPPDGRQPRGGTKAPRAIQELLIEPRSRPARLKTASGRFLEARTTEPCERGPLRNVRAILLRDITDQYRDERRLVRLAHYDSLTGLANRRLFLERIRRILESARQAGDMAALFYLDLDRFKEINDSHGHAAGDVLLRTLAERLRDCFESEDLAALGIPAGAPMEMARLAGDEFAIISPPLPDPGAAAELAERVLKLVAAPLQIGSQRLSNSASIGIALFPEDAADVETLLRHADAALYVAKSRGRGRYAFYEPSFDEKADRKHKIEQGLREAIQGEELLLHYQPKVDVASSAVVGFEALLRWKSRHLGNVGPREFIPVAEERGLITELGSWCLEEACRQLKRWREAGFAVVPVSVNVSSAQFREANLLQVVSDALTRHGVEPHLLELELTESLLLTEGEQAALALRDLRAFGIGIALDDFGTGYSALSYLNRFPIDVLKMDRSLLREIESSPAAAGIASAVVAMAHSLGLRVVAEGVDSEGQLGPLGDMRCDQIQGFLYAPAVSADEAQAFLARAGERPALVRPRPNLPGRITLQAAGQPSRQPVTHPGASLASADLPRERQPSEVANDGDLWAQRSGPGGDDDADLPSHREAPEVETVAAFRQPAARNQASAPRERAARMEPGAAPVDAVERRVLLMDDAAGSLGPLGLRLARLGVDVHYASSPDEARLFVAQEGRAIRLLAVPPGLDLAHAIEVLDLIKRDLGARPPLIAIGEEPDAATRLRMRQAGVAWILWAPFDDNELRFLVKAALASPKDLAQRCEPRVPVDILAQVRVGARREVAVLSSLSSRGAFIELSDPPPLGGQLRVDFELPPERFRLFGRIVHRQEEDAAAPLSPAEGVGVVFYGIDRAAELALRKAVEERAARYLP